MGEIYFFSSVLQFLLKLGKWSAPSISSWMVRNSVLFRVAQIFFKITKKILRKHNFFGEEWSCVIRHQCCCSNCLDHNFFSSSQLNFVIARCQRFYSYLLNKSEDKGIIQMHSSEIRGLCSTKCSSKMLQNLLYFMYKKTHVVFFVFHFVQLYIFTL